MINHSTKTKRERVGGLYLCQFSQGTIKVGMGKDVADRLASHKAAGAVFGISVVRVDLIACDNPRKAEKLLIEWCANNATDCNGREWFQGMDYDDCLDAAKLAALSMMGPHLVKPARPDILDIIIGRCTRVEQTKESDLYRDVRGLMVSGGVASEVLAAFDYLHRESEKVRSNIRAGGAMPEWYDLLNCFEFWEIELWFDSGKPSFELLTAAAEAMQTLTRIAEGAEVVYVA